MPGVRICGLLGEHRLKIRSREKRGMGSNPIIGTYQNAILLGKVVRICDFFDCEQSRTKTHEMTLYLPSICQVSDYDCADSFNLRFYCQGRR
jgi:hypothetical protein